MRRWENRGRWARPSWWFAYGWWRRHAAHGEGAGYSGPERYLLGRCCKCGQLRAWVEMVEMFSPNLCAGWWHECLRCALESITARVEAEQRARGAS